MKQDANRQMEQILETLPRDPKPRLLLHSCCGPCSSAVLERLMPHFTIVLFYYNPNMDSREEFEKRLQTQRELLTKLPGGDEVELVAGDYDHEVFLTRIHGLHQEPEGGKRCTVCFALRMEESAKIARELHCDYFATTLSVSPHKNPAILNALGDELAGDGLSYLPSDFKKKDGYLQSIRLSRAYGLYRQEYCGCEFSRWMDKKENGQ